MPTAPSPSLPAEPLRPIIQEICSNPCGAFSGFGRHLANDFLFEMAIFPGMPSYIIWENPEEFERLEVCLFRFMEVFDSDEYLNMVATVPNSDNPFTFNEASNDVYLEQYVTVFRRSRAMVHTELYFEYCRKGLFDSQHTIGTTVFVVIVVTRTDG